MDSNQKAKELYDKFKEHSLIISYFDEESLSFMIDKTISAKQCALLCVDEMIKLANLMDGGFSFEKEIEFLKEVKQEIEKL